MSNKVDSFGTSYSLNKINKKNPIIFIHGVGLTKEIWEPQINFLKDYNTLTYDLLGHGKTPLKKSTVSFKDFSTQLVKLINELNFKKIHLVGFSLGALIARHFAYEHSDRLSSLIIRASIYKRTEDQKRVVKNRFEVAKTNRPSSKHSAIRRWLSEEFIRNNKEIYDKIYSMLEEINHNNLLKAYKLFAYYEDDDEILGKINVNTLVTTGQNDLGSTTEMAKNLTEKIRSAKYIEIKKGKHLCNIECAEDFNKTIELFVDQNYDEA